MRLLSTCSKYFDWIFFVFRILNFRTDLQLVFCRIFHIFFKTAALSTFDVSIVTILIELYNQVAIASAFIHHLKYYQKMEKDYEEAIVRCETTKGVFTMKMIRVRGMTQTESYFYCDTHFSCFVYCFSFVTSLSYRIGLPMDMIVR